MGTVISLKDFRLQRDLTLATAIYESNPGALEELTKQLTLEHNLALFRQLDRQIERLDKEVYTDTGIRFDILQRKQDLVRERMALATEMNKG